MKVEVDLSDAFVQLLIAASLKDTYDMFKKDKKTAFFSFDKAKEKAERQRYREAFALVHNWFSSPDLHIKG